MLKFITVRVLNLLKKDSDFWEEHVAQFDVSMRVHKDGSLLLSGGAGAQLDHRDRIFAIGKFWLRIMKEKALLFVDLPENKSLDKLDLSSMR